LENEKKSVYKLLGKDKSARGLWMKNHAINEDLEGENESMTIS
jgi:hypothetical protein